MKNLPKALVSLKGATIAAIREYAGDLEYDVRQDAFEFASECQRGRFLDEEEWESARQTADDAQDAAHYAIAPLRWIAYYSDAQQASDLYSALAEGWRRLESYFDEGEWDALIEARAIMARVGGAV